MHDAVGTGLHAVGGAVGTGLKGAGTAVTAVGGAAGGVVKSATHAVGVDGILRHNDNSVTQEEQQRLNKQKEYYKQIAHELETIKTITKAYNEPVLNLHFLGPYLKNTTSSIGQYDMIFQMISVIRPKDRTTLVDLLEKEIRKFKYALIYGETEDNKKVDG